MCNVYFFCNVGLYFFKNTQPVSQVFVYKIKILDIIFTSIDIYIYLFLLTILKIIYKKFKKLVKYLIKNIIKKSY